jgi:Transport and Golgi organisation 2
MCTVTVLPGPWLTPAPGQPPLAARLAVSRDELRSRPRASGPAPVAFGDRQAIAPLDPVGGGTWVAVTDVGLAFALLNVNESAGDPDPRRASRGRIIPTLGRAGNLERCLAEAERLDPAAFNPCRVVVLDGQAIGEIVIRRERLRIRTMALGSPFIRVSSSLGDRRVGRRLDLFERWFPTPRAVRRHQDDFHRHRWPRRGPSSVRMRRRDAGTVSITTIELFEHRAHLMYQEVDHDAIAPPVGLELKLVARP